MTRDEILALEAGRKLDALVATEVMGLLPMSLDGDTNCPYCGNKMRPTIERAWCSVCHEWRYSPYMEYSTDIAAAWEVVERMRECGVYLTIVTRTDSYVVTASRFHPEFNCYTNIPDIDFHSDLLPPAICFVALLAKMQP